MSKILVIRGGAIGDFILTLPVLSALRRQFPIARLEVLGYPHIARLAVAGGLADAVRAIDARPLAGFFARDATLDPELQNYFANFAIIISFLYDPDGIFEANVRRSCKGQFIAGPHRPDETKNLHATATFLEPLQRLAIFDPDRIPRLTLPGARPSTLVPQQTIAIHPGSGSEKKNWPLQNWITLLLSLISQPSTLNFLITAGEAETSKLDALTRALPPDRIELAVNLPLTALAERLATCSLFIGHDSGITHLAAALDVSTVALWAETSESIWRPLGNHVTLLRSPHGLPNLEPNTVLNAICQM